MPRSRSILVALLGLSVAGCAAIPVPSIALLPQPGPVQVVGAALGSVIDHDLAGAIALVCPESRRRDGLPFDVGPIFLPLGSLGEIEAADALALVVMTPVNISAEVENADDEAGVVHVRGGLALQYDLAATRRYAVQATDGLDPALVDRVMLVAGDGRLAVSVDARVPVARRGGTWIICGASEDG